MNYCDLNYVIESFLLEHLLSVEEKGGNLIDFLPSIESKDEWILKNWIDHFKDRQVPYCVTETCKIKTMWIIQPTQTE